LWFSNDLQQLRGGHCHGQQSYRKKPVEKICAMSVNHLGTRQDYYFKGKISACHYWRQRLILLLMQDITRQQQLESLEKHFFMTSAIP
jgi:hypothetical protein